MDTTTLELRVFGLSWTVEVPVDRLETIRAQWNWCLPDSPAQRSIASIEDALGPAAPPDSSDEAVVHRPDDATTSDGHAADYALTTSLTGRAISACSGRLFMFHAAALADVGTGRVAGLVAPSGTGKTTAAHTFCTSPEFGYVTDETLVTNDSGEVMPYPKPLSVIIGDADRRKSQHGPDELGFTPPPPGELVLGPIIMLDRITTSEIADDPAGREEQDSPRLEPLPLIEGLKMMLPQSSAVPLIPDCLDKLAELARRGGGFHRLIYREIAETTPLIRAAFDAPPAARDWIHVAGTWPTGDTAPGFFGHRADFIADTPLTDETSIERGPFVDAVVVEDHSEALVLIGDLPLHLRGLGVRIWTSLEAPRTVASLTAECIETFGEHPEAEKLVLDALNQLEESRVIVRTKGPNAAEAAPANA